MKLFMVCGAASLWAIAACTTTEDRPETLAYITEAILAPNCGTAECHSAMKRQSNYVFDSVAAAQLSIAGNYGAGGSYGPLIATQTPTDPSVAYLITVITSKDTFGNRMPLDQPLANKDIVLIGNWISDGASGYVLPP